MWILQYFKPGAVFSNISSDPDGGSSVLVTRVNIQHIASSHPISDLGGGGAPEGTRGRKGRGTRHNYGNALY